MRVFLDTNVLISAFTTRGLCADILRQVLIHQELLICPPLLDEIRSVLTNKFGMPAELVSGIQRFHLEGTIEIDQMSQIKVEVNDQDDKILLGHALKGKSEFL